MYTMHVCINLICALLIVLPIVSDETLAQAQLAEYVHHDVHGGVVGNGERAQIHDATKLQWGRTVGWLWRCVFSEEDFGRANHTLLTLPSVICQREMKNNKPSVRHTIHLHTNTIRD